MEWVTNATRKVTLDNVMPRSIAMIDGTTVTETRLEALAHERKFRAGLLPGAPKATEQHTVDELRAMGMIGLYRR